MNANRNALPPFRFLPPDGTTPFVIICLPRTGSKLLAEMLDSHPEILCHTEVFNPKSTYLSRKPHLQVGTKAERDQDPWGFLRRLYAESDGARIIGFKIMPRHRDRVLLALLLSRRTKKIVLTRRNLLETFVSNQIALRTRKYHVSAGEPVIAPTPSDAPPLVQVNIRALRTYFRKVRMFYFVVRCISAITSQRFFTLDYTDIKQEATMKALLSFLGAKTDVELEERLRKQSAGTLAEKISNYTEVAAALKGTRWERLLDT